MSDCVNNSCVLKLEDNQDTILLLQLKREVEELLKTTTARLLSQDGKISETCVYIKENLSNELRLLLDTMQNSGELENIINTIVLGSIELLQNQVEFEEMPAEIGVINRQFPYGNIKRYGAKGDGVSDDTGAINTTAENCRNFNLPLTAPGGIYKITADINLRFIKRINFEGDIITSNTSAFVNIGNRSADGAGCELKFKTIPRMSVKGLKNSLVSFVSCETMSIFADGDDSESSSTAYTQFYGAYCKNIVIDSIGSAIGWINENIFRIKRIENISFSGNYQHNNNHFEHCNLEKGTVHFGMARNNYISARCEGDITVTGEDAQANFIEREYYYLHYFGEDVTEDEIGTVISYPVNKLQTEKELYKLDMFNKVFPVNSVRFNENGTFSGVTYTPVFKSNLIKIDKTFALKMKCSEPGLRVQLNFYDADKNRITAEVENFADGKMSYIDSGEWSYVIGSNVNNDTVVFFPGTAKFVEYRVIFGDGAELKTFDYITIKLLKYINTDIHIMNTLKNNVYTAVPSSGYWEKGQMLFANNPVPGTYIGIICTESGTPGVWKNFSQIQE